MMFFISNDTSWKSRRELLLDWHYRIRIGGFGHFGDLRRSFVVLSLPASKKRYDFSIVSSSQHKQNTLDFYSDNVTYFTDT